MNIIIAGEQYIFREGLRSILSDLNESFVVAECDNYDDLLSRLNESNTDLLIGDLFSLPDFHFSSFKTLEKKFPNIKFLIISNIKQEENIIESLDCEIVKGFISVNSSRVDVITAVTMIANNSKSFDPEVIEYLQQHISKKQNTKGEKKHFKKLTKRETEIVILVAEGKTAKETAEIMNISTHTVNTYKKNIFKKLNVSNSSELVMFAIKNKFIHTNEYYI